MAVLMNRPGGSLTFCRAAFRNGAHLAQLRDQPAAALVRRRVVEHHLAGERRRQRVGVELRAPLVRADALELEEPGVDVLLHRRAIEPIVEAQRVGPDAGQPAGEAAQLAGLAIQRRAREVLDVVVERVHAVERRRRRPQLVQVAEIVVDEVLNGFERVHGRARGGGSGRGPALPGTVGRGKRSHIKWYNNGGPSSAAGRSRRAPTLEVVCPTRRRQARCSSWRRRSATSKTLRYAPSECCAKCR